MRLFKKMLLVFVSCLLLVNAYSNQIYIASSDNQDNVPKHYQSDSQQFSNQPQPEQSKLNLNAESTIVSARESNILNDNDPSANAQINYPNKASNSINNYTDQAKNIWFDRCLTAVSGTKVKAYAHEYCECGWQHIVDGELPQELLASMEPIDIKKRNEIMAAITQMCMVTLIQQHNL